MSVQSSDGLWKQFKDSLKWRKLDNNAWEDKLETLAAEDEDFRKVRTTYYARLNQLPASILQDTDEPIKTP